MDQNGWRNLIDWMYNAKFDNVNGMARDLNIFDYLERIRQMGRIWKASAPQVRLVKVLMLWRVSIIEVIIKSQGGSCSQYNNHKTIYIIVFFNIDFVYLYTYTFIKNSAQIFVVCSTFILPPLVLIIQFEFELEWKLQNVVLYYIKL